ncbi:MAG: Hsp20/alpha crystallin family protein [Bacteroidetes bacterium]|nr:Hsp20/alpha crystallin family protein [Bacteroidota bacterium]
MSFAPGFGIPVKRREANKTKSPENQTRSYNRPAVNIMHQPNAYEIQVAVPGYDRNAIRVELDKDVLTISADAKKPAANYTRREIRTGAFERRFQLPENIEVEAIEANHKNGVLSIHLPIAEAAKPRQIEVA